MFGLALYSLDRLYKAVEGHARETGEWLNLREDIVDLGRPELEKADKLAVISLMERIYYCLLPSLPSSRWPSLPLLGIVCNIFAHAKNLTLVSASNRIWALHWVHVKSTNTNFKERIGSP